MKARILAYHRVCEDTAPELRTWSVRPAVFKRQMAMLKRLGYRGVTVREALASVDRGASDEKLVGLSFDDGYRDTVEIAFPILEEFGFTASVYVVAGAVGKSARWDPHGASINLATWEELQQLVDAGWEAGLHSTSHPARFDLLDAQELESEITSGIQRVLDNLATTVDTFAYPHGNYSHAAMTAVQEAGLAAAVTTDPGMIFVDSPRFQLPRYEIKHRDTLLEFSIWIASGILIRRRSTLESLIPSRFRRSGREENETGFAADDAHHRTRDVS